MKLFDLFKLSIAQVRIPRKLTLLLLMALILSILSPSSVENPLNIQNRAAASNIARAANDYGRFVNTLLQVAIPVLLFDRVGLAQLVVIGVTTTFATHVLKRVLNNVVIDGVRLGQRPSGVGSKHNTPSGHSSMASSAVYFLARRYGRAFLLITVPVLLLTMFARVALGAHSLSGVLSGALVGLLMATLFTSRRCKCEVPLQSTSGISKLQD